MGVGRLCEEDGEGQGRGGGWAVKRGWGWSGERGVIGMGS